MGILLSILVVIGAVAVYDILQRHHAILHNFPVIGHFRYWLEAVGPELRQYIVTNNDEERPFSRDERRWVYTASKRNDTYFGFGSDNEMETAGQYLIVKHAPFPVLEPPAPHPGSAPNYDVPCAKMLGEHRKRARPYRPGSVVGVSGMSFGALGANAVRALNRGATEAGCWQNTGEGGVSAHHLHGADHRLVETVGRHERVRAIEIKLSQGAKPGIGGILPAAKVSSEIAAARGVPEGTDCLSPPRHSAFGDADGLLDFVEQVAEATGLPVGIKSAVGESAFWDELAGLMSTGTRAVDFVTIDGGEGGSGAGPLAFLDHVALPFRHAFSRVYRSFAEHGVADQTVFIASGKLGFPERALAAFAIGADMIAVAREPMLSIGCIQAQRCHTGHCPVGITTHNRWLTAGLDPDLKAPRLANYIRVLRKELLRLSRACGHPHPALVGASQLEIVDGAFKAESLSSVLGYTEAMATPSQAKIDAVANIMSGPT
jgi:glutamate synthase domain-containing protein 2